MKTDWRQQIIESITNLFTDTYSSLYGLNHALEVEKYLIRIVNSSDFAAEFRHTWMEVILAAALLHDVGFAHRSGEWSTDGYEHIETGIELAAEVLRQNPYFQINAELIAQVLFLIEHHDDTIYSYPSLSNEGRPLISKEGKNKKYQSRDLEFCLRILQEADALVHTEEPSIGEVFKEWIELSLPVSKPHGHPISTWQWMDSALGNVRLLAKRSVVDAYTDNGQEAALKNYSRVEAFIQEQCAIENISYEPEICHPSMRQDSLDRFKHKQYELDIVNYAGWQELQRKLPKIHLKGDEDLKPYHRARFHYRFRRFDEIFPMALYIMQARLDGVQDLFDALMVEYCLGLWDLPGLLTFTYQDENHPSGEIQSIAPPIIESYQETDIEDESYLALGLLDGLHRCSLAREAGMDGLFVIEITDISIPPIPLPVEWNEVKVYQEAPSAKYKRRFRYPNLGEFPHFDYIIKRPETDEEARNYFYRDLGILGSKGKRFE